jgi:hypothetical protein
LPTESSIALGKLVCSVDLCIETPENIGEALQILPVGSGDDIDILRGPHIAVVANGYSPDKQELNLALHQLPENRLDVELRHCGGGGRLRPLWT